MAIEVLVPELSSLTHQQLNARFVLRFPAVHDIVSGVTLPAATLTVSLDLSSVLTVAARARVNKTGRATRGPITAKVSQ